MAVDLAAAFPGPLPPEHLLRWGGSDDPLASGPARGEAGPDAHLSALVVGDAACILGSCPVRVTRTRWRSVTFIRQVEAVRAHLAPIAEPALLLSSLGREAFRGGRTGIAPTAGASPVRIAYAIRWIELIAGLRLPEWALWTDACAPDP